MSGVGNVEGLLARALAPVDPPEDLAARLRSALQSLSDLAAGELEGWERSAIEARRWARPVTAALSATLAGAGLLILGRRRRSSDRTNASPLDGPG